MSDDAQAPELPTNLVDLLDQLVLPPEPEPVSMVPQTAGWGVLLVLVLIGVAFGVWRLHAHRQRNAYRRVALAALESCKDPAEIAGVIRRCALVAYPRAEVASLIGADWLTFLDKAAGSTAFTAGPGRAIATAPFRDGGAADAALLDVARTWVRTHKPEAT